MNTAYVTRAGHCTRCEAPFAADTTIYMVRERVIWEVTHDGRVFWEWKTVAACEQCLTVQEQAYQHTALGTCGGCAHRLMLAAENKYRDGRQWAVRACCDRCVQRIRRNGKCKRIRRSTWCTDCGKAFDAKRTATFCSPACRQRAYRQRRGMREAMMRREEMRWRDG